ncbi:unnamed protein product, partial [Owenia fusiformis]
VLNNLRSIQLLKVLTLVISNPDVQEILMKKKLTNVVNVDDCILVNPVITESGNQKANKIIYRGQTIRGVMAPKYTRRNDLVIAYHFNDSVSYAEVQYFIHIDGRTYASTVEY